MAYNNSYDASDVAPIVIDGFGTILVTIIGVAGLVALVLLYRFFRGKKLL